MRRRILVEGLMLGLATSTYGVAFGVAARAAGLSSLMTSAMSVLVFTGASQLAAVAVLDAGGTETAAVGVAAFLALRHLTYGPAILDALPSRVLPRALASHLIIDESTALARAHSRAGDRRVGFWSAGLSVFVLWNLGTALGIAVGGVIRSPQQLGLDAVFPAAVVSLLWPQLKAPTHRRRALVAVGVALAATPLLPVGAPPFVAGTAAVATVRGRPE